MEYQLRDREMREAITVRFAMIHHGCIGLCHSFWIGCVCLGDVFLTLLGREEVCVTWALLQPVALLMSDGMCVNLRETNDKSKPVKMNLVT
eukprot:scaffold172536_cov57-Cyclotella_meneghiniana.AAC.3